MSASNLIHQAHLKPYFDDTDPSFAKRITVHVVNAKMMDALATALRATDLEAKLLSNRETVVIRERTGSAAARNRSLDSGVVVGRVTDSASGQGLGGATVRVSQGRSCPL